MNQVLDFSMLLPLGSYFLVAALIVRTAPRALRNPAFAFCNASALLYFFDWGTWSGGLALYCAWTLGHYFFVRFMYRHRLLYLAAMLFPLLVLVWSKVGAGWTQEFLVQAGANREDLATWSMVGLSFMAFRLSILPVELRARNLPPPDPATYLSFAFFLPTLLVGPISAYPRFVQSMDDSHGHWPEAIPALCQLLVGAVKYLVLATVCDQLSFSGYFWDHNQHGLPELLVSGVGFYLYVYFSFSGFCEFCIGAARLIGIEIDDNFRNPLASRNLQVFWGTWHITLGRYVGSMVFTPLTKWLVRRWGTDHLHAATVSSILLSFLVIGVWHGQSWNFLLFGAMHGLGVIVVYSWSLLLKRWLGLSGYRRYLNNRSIALCAWLLTFLYISLSVILFANEPAQLELLWRQFRGV